MTINAVNRSVVLPLEPSGIRRAYSTSSGTVSNSSTIFADLFDNGTLTAAQGSARWLARSAGISDSVFVAAFGLSSSYGLMFLYGGDTSSASDAWAEQRFDLGIGYPEVTVEFKLRIPNGSESYSSAAFVHRANSIQASNNKLFVLWCNGDDGTADGGPGVAWEYWRDGVNGSYLTVHWNEGEGKGAGTHEQPKTFIRIPDDRGTVLSMKMYVKMATSRITPINPSSDPYNIGDGLIKTYIKREGDSAYSLIQNVTTANVFALNGTGFRWGYLMGWANSGFTNTTKFILDNFIVSAGSV